MEKYILKENLHDTEGNTFAKGSTWVVKHDSMAFIHNQVHLYDGKTDIVVTKMAFDNLFNLRRDEQ